MSIFKESSINKRVKLLAPGTPSCIISLIILVFFKKELASSDIYYLSPTAKQPIFYQNFTEFPLITLKIS